MDFERVESICSLTDWRSGSDTCGNSFPKSEGPPGRDLACKFEMGKLADFIFQLILLVNINS